MRLRAGLGILVAVGAIALAAPATWVPWGSAVRAAMPGWWMLPLIFAVLALVAGLLLPPPGREPEHGARNVTLGLGLLLVLEPFLHLALLGYLSRNQAPGGEELLLPTSVGTSSAGVMLRGAIIALLAPIVEEWFFRGRLLPYLETHLGRFSAISISALAFACAHGSPLAMLVAVPVGVLLGWMRLYRNDLGACVLIHQAHNGLFLVAGPALVTAPRTALVLAAGGAVLLALAALTRPRNRAAAMLVALALAAGLALAIPGLVTLQDRWWARGAARVLARERAMPGPAIARLDEQHRRGRLTERRRQELVLALDGKTSPGARAALLLLGAPPEDDPEENLRAAIACLPPSSGLVAAVRTYAGLHPKAWAAVKRDFPEWTPLF